MRATTLAPLLVLALGIPTGGNAQTTLRTAATQCASVESLRLPDLRIVSAEARPRDTRPGATARVPHCLVAGVIGREIRFWVWLPDRWNRRFFMGGAGGFAGRLDNQALSSLNDGYATAATDTGHDFDGIQAGWALNNVERQLNYGHLAMHRTVEVAKAVIRSYYGRDPVRSYFFGCSNGGRQALMEAQRYPGDFDGIVAGAPALSITRVVAAFIKNIQAAFPDPAQRTTSAVSPENLRLLEKSVLAACDARDGVSDGVLGDPGACRFTAAALPACAGDQPGPDCVTPSQRAAIEQVYSTLRRQDEVIYRGQTPGGEADPAGWLPWITGASPQLLQGSGGKFPSLQFAFGTEFFKYFIFADSAWDYSRYDLSRWKQDTRLVSTFLDGDDPDLSQFKRRNGKLLLWHGWADPALNPLETIAYYDAVEQRDPAAREFARLFLMPGVMHCSGGPGPDQVNWYREIRSWVEAGKAPDRIVAAKLDSTRRPVRTRPLCAYPRQAVHSGTGSTDDAANFACSNR